LISEIAVSVGRRVAGRPTADANAYWAARVWDREQCSEAPVLGPHYLAETMGILALIRQRVSDRELPPVRRAIDVGCGVGVFTAALLEAGVDEVVALDISPGALKRTRERVKDDSRLRTVQADVRQFEFADNDRADEGSGLFDALVCVDALHHIGDPIPSLEAMCRLVNPGGVLIGNIWTADHFHEFQRTRHGPARHAAASIAFCAAAFARRFGRETNLTRTELVPADEACEQLAARFEVLHVAESRYWVRFMVRR